MTVYMIDWQWTGYLNEGYYDGITIWRKDFDGRTLLIEGYFEGRILLTERCFEGRILLTEGCFDGRILFDWRINGKDNG